MFCSTATVLQQLRPHPRCASADMSSNMKGDGNHGDRMSGFGTLPLTGLASRIYAL